MIDPSEQAKRDALRAIRQGGGGSRKVPGVPPIDGIRATAKITKKRHKRRKARLDATPEA